MQLNFKRGRILLIFIFYPLAGLFAQTGNVGIGTTTPSEKLHVAGNVLGDTLKAGMGIQFLPGAGSGRVLMSDADGNASWSPVSAFGTVTSVGSVAYVPKFSPDGFTLDNSLIYESGSNLGIGTTTPLFPVTLNTPAGLNNWGFMHTDGSVEFGDYIGANTFAELGTRSYHPLYLFTDNIDFPPAMTIDKDGVNIGLGTTIPQCNLDIRGSNPRINLTDNGVGSANTISRYANRLEIQVPDIFQVAMGTTANPSFIIKSNGFIGMGDNTPVNKLQIGTTVGFSGNDLAIGDNGKAMSFYQAAATSIWYSNTNFALMPNTGLGNVGIGTLNPTYKLSVNGTIQAKEVRVETGWADFVFEKDYQLPSLDSVEAFTKTYQHLPGIPSAAEISAHGLAVGETQTQMMQKIEELTLYVIELKKEIGTLKKLRP